MKHAAIVLCMLLCGCQAPAPQECTDGGRFWSALRSGGYVLAPGPVEDAADACDCEAAP